ncbi:hypothetical protein CB1_000350042 [Camelus ferus]|nr:hypothetical protein CB1_000350042 [Camelus ferus]
MLRLQRGLALFGEITATVYVLKTYSLMILKSDCHTSLQCVAPVPPGRKAKKHSLPAPQALPVQRNPTSPSDVIKPREDAANQLLPSTKFIPLCTFSGFDAT